MGNEYVDAGYADDGTYFFTSRQFIFTYGAARLELRGPASRSGSIRLLQPEETTAGWVRYGYTPRAIIHTLKLDYRRMSATEAADLATFRAAVDYTAKQFSYINGATGEIIPCWFEQPEQEIEQAGFNLYRGQVAFLAITPFIAYPGSPPANLDAILATAQYPYKQTISRAQQRLWMSNGTPRIYNQSGIKRTTHGITLVRKSAADLGALLSYFVNTAVGIKNRWPWTDGGTPRSVRFAEPVIEWRQSPLNTALYDVDLVLEEDQ